MKSKQPDRILVAIPSLDRPKLVQRCLASLFDNGTGAFDVLVIQNRRGGIIKALNSSLPPQLLERYSVLGVLNDDMVVRTPGWDALVLKELSEAPGLLYGRDGIQDARMATWHFMNVEIPLALCYIWPPQFSHMRGDMAMTEIARRAGCLHYKPDLFIEHLHYTAGKSEKDATYAEAYSHNADDQAAWKEFVDCILPGDANAVKQAIQPLLK